MKVGNGVFIGSNCSLDALGGLQIGNYCALASYTTILTVDHHHRGAESIPWGEARIIKPVLIEDCVWIGMNASILPGVSMGAGAIVGLGAVIPKDVPSRAIVVGNPGRIIGYRDEDEYNTLKARGAVRAPSARCTQLWIPPEMWKKYHSLLQEVGYDVDNGREHFEFESSDP
ncbi:MAG: acyltransferase [Sedimentisphaerales bacterium]